MTNKSYFFRDVEDVNELNNKTNMARANNERMSKFCVREQALLSDEEFKKFASNFKHTYDFITPHRVFLGMNDNYEYVCLEVRSASNDFSILVNTSGHSYARNVAIKKHY